MIDYVDVVMGLSWGDEGKGKITAALAPQYDWVARYNGGPNAGHTVVIDGVTYKLHQIPSGSVYNKQCYIGPGCVVNYTKLIEELNSLPNFDPQNLWVHPDVALITGRHIEDDSKGNYVSQGSTNQGIAYAYADKYKRQAVTMGEMTKLNKPSWNVGIPKLGGAILAESAQGVWLDLIHGKYPYVTSSHCLPYFACSLGFSHKKLRKVVGVSKVYDTRSGIGPDFMDPKIQMEYKNDLERLQVDGNEFGTTTGRKRDVNFLNLSKLINAINLTATDILVMNKMDILDYSAIYNLIYNGYVLEFDRPSDFQRFIITELENNTDVGDIIWSYSPTDITDWKRYMGGVPERTNGTVLKTVAGVSLP